MDWQQQFGFLLDSVAHRYARRFNEHARGLSLTLQQCKALAVLANCQGINQRRLAETTVRRDQPGADSVRDGDTHR
jgi:hypothetical protein